MTDEYSQTPSNVPAYVTAAIRWGSTKAAGALVSAGFITHDNELMVVGLLTGLFTLAWSEYRNHLIAKRLKQAQASSAPLAATPKVPK